ncbi:MAG TPA: hypothetical protein VN969_10830 [Streptosporangiaceae bacterium]|nr:hypothetical protein [Streptosporangiaceae bacterium]
MNVIIVIVCAATVLVTALLAVVVAGIRLETPTSELPTKAPNLTAAIVRRALGVSVRKPDTAEHTYETCLTGHGPSGWSNGRYQ